MSDESRRRKHARGSRFLTTGERIGGYVGWGFILALTLHAVLVPFARAPGQPAAGPQQPSIMNVATLPKKPPPTPPPTPTPPPHHVVRPRESQPSSQARPRPPHVPNAVGSPQPPVQSTTEPTTPANVGLPVSASPIAQATVAACPQPDQDAHTVTLAAPEYPPLAEQEGAGERVVQVAVTISPAGSVVNEAIVSTSGIASIDRDALRVARETTYAPRIEDCRPVQGTYKYVIDYQSN